jgi:hypothetical protein
MRTNPARVSLTRLLWTDYPSFYASLIPLVAWIVYLAWAPDWRGLGPVLKPGAQPVFLGTAIIATLISLVVLVIRIRLFIRIFREGMQVHGKIMQAELRRDRGKVEYTYIYDHQEFFSRADIHRNGATKALQTGDQVTLLVDPKKPTRAFIRDLYIQDQIK